MAATRHTLTADLADLLDDALPVAANGKSKVHVYLTTNLPDGDALVDTSANKVFLSGGAKEITHDNGVFTASLISTDSTDINVTGLQYRIVASYVSPKGSGSNPAVAERLTWDSGYFSFTADTDLSDVAGSSTLTPANPSGFARITSTDGTGGYPLPTGNGVELVFSANGLDDIRVNGVSA